MASVTLTDNQWKTLMRMGRGAAAGGSVVIDVTAGLLTVTKFGGANGTGTATEVAHKSGAAGDRQS